LFGVLGLVTYRHGAPNGAFSKPYSTENSKQPKPTGYLIAPQGLTQNTMRDEAPPKRFLAQNDPKRRIGV
jgi:hypothetical protein